MTRCRAARSLAIVAPALRFSTQQTRIILDERCTQRLTKCLRTARCGAARSLAIAAPAMCQSRLRLHRLCVSSKARAVGRPVTRTQARFPENAERLSSTFDERPEDITRLNIVATADERLQRVAQHGETINRNIQDAVHCVEDAFCPGLLAADIIVNLNEKLIAGLLDKPYIVIGREVVGGYGRAALRDDAICLIEITDVVKPHGRASRTTPGDTGP